MSRIDDNRIEHIKHLCLKAMKSYDKVIEFAELYPVKTTISKQEYEKIFILLKEMTDTIETLHKISREYKARKALDQVIIQLPLQGNIKFKDFNELVRKSLNEFRTIFLEETEQ